MPLKIRLPFTRETKDIPVAPQPTPAAAVPAERKTLSFPATQFGSNKPYNDEWDLDRAVDHAVNRVVWVFKSVHAIASNAASLRVVMRKDDPEKGSELDVHPFATLMNRTPNPYQDAWTFRYQLSSQILLSRKGAFVEIERNRLGEPKGLYLLPPQHTSPIPHPDKFISGYKVQVPGRQTRVLPPENVAWLGLPHPLNPYMKMTPLESAGLSVEIDWYARLYNRNFLMNDGRPGGILVVEGELDDDDVDELRRRFMGPTGSAISGAGRVSVVEAESATFVDTATSARDGQYMEARAAAKTETLVAFGVPESVIGNASERTFENADAELEAFWRETMHNHLRLHARSLDRIADDDPTTFVGFDLSDVYVLGRDQRELKKFALEELKANAITQDEYRILTGREAIGADKLFQALNMHPVASESEGELDWPEPGQIGRNGTLSLDAGEETPAKEPAKAPKKIAEIPPELKALPSPEEDLERTRADFDRRLTRWEKSAAAQLARYFDRQERVVLQKVAGKKIRDAIEKGKEIDAAQVFDLDSWNEQLKVDSEAWISAVADDFGTDAAERMDERYGDVSDTVEEAARSQVERLGSLNTLTLHRIAEAIKAGGDADAVVEAVRQVFGSSKTRAARVARTEVVCAANAAISTVVEFGGGTKTWLMVTPDSHADLNGKFADTSFQVKGSTVSHPGDPSLGPEDLVNCRCVLLASRFKAVDSK